MIAAMIKSAVVLAIAACIASIMRRQSAAVRHTIWTAGLFGALAIPLCTLALPSWQTEMGAQIVAVVVQISVALGRGRAVAIVIWLAGATAALSLLLYSAARLAWVAFCSEPVEDKRWERLAEEVRKKLAIRRPVRLLQNRSVPFLGTWGIVAPRVLLPADAESWPDDRVQMVLAHELAHIKRHDWVVQVLADAARAIYWFNPIFWLASSRLRRESEHACDDAVVRLGVGGIQYAEQLLQMTRDLRSERGLQSPILAMAQPSHLEQRLVALLNPSLNRLAATPWAVLVVAGVAIALTLPLAAVRSLDTPQTVTTLVMPEPKINVATAEPPPVAPAPTTVRPAAAAKPPVVNQPDRQPKPEEVVTPAPAPAADPEPANPQPATPPAVVAEVKPPDAQTATALVIPETRIDVAPVEVKPPAPPFVCNVTTSNFQTKTSTVEKTALGNGPWIVNQDRTIWAADQPYIAGRIVNTIWMRPANTVLRITGHRLDGDAPLLEAVPAAPYSTAYLAIGLAFPASGCWEVTATAGNSKLTFITSVRE